MTTFRVVSPGPNLPIERGERILDAAVRHSVTALRAEGSADEVSLFFTRYCHWLTDRERRSVHLWARRYLDTLGVRNAATDWEFYVIGNIARDTFRS